jgi:hypothetical protein
LFSSIETTIISKFTRGLDVRGLFLGAAIQIICDTFFKTFMTSHRFHHRLTRAFFVQIFRQSHNVTRKGCRNDVCAKNLYVKTLMKLTLGGPMALQNNSSIGFESFWVLRAFKSKVKSIEI